MNRIRLGVSAFLMLIFFQNCTKSPVGSVDALQESAPVGEGAPAVLGEKLGTSGSWSRKDSGRVAPAPAASPAAPGSYDMRRYWPAVSKSEAMIRHWVYSDGTPVRTSKYYGTSNTNEFLNVDFRPDGLWEATWVMRQDPERGVLETSNQFPLAKGSDNYVYSAGSEILWGKNLKAPVHGVPQFDCQGIALAEGNVAIGYQCLGIVDVRTTFTVTAGGVSRTFEDVLVVAVTQQMPKSNSADSVDFKAYMYFVQGIGFVQVDLFRSDWTYHTSVYAPKICSVPRTSNAIRCP